MRVCSAATANPSVWISLRAEAGTASTGKLRISQSALREQTRKCLWGNTVMTHGCALLRTGIILHGATDIMALRLALRTRLISGNLCSLKTHFFPATATACFSPEKLTGCIPCSADPATTGIRLSGTFLSARVLIWSSGEGIAMWWVPREEIIPHGSLRRWDRGRFPLKRTRGGFWFTTG